MRVIEEERVTTSHMVPTQLHRMLGLSEEVRGKYDMSSLRTMIHAAAPCPVEIKQRMMKWWGPVVYEYYAASEGGGTTPSLDAANQEVGGEGEGDDGEQAAGGYAERVEDPQDVPAAIGRALKVVREEKRQALLNVIGS